MTAGVPGIGLSGIFYIFCGLLMPVIEFFSVLFRKSKGKRWKLVMTQFSLSAGILLSTWLFGLVIGILISHSKIIASSFRQLHAVNILKVQPLIISLTTLLVVVASIRIFYWITDSLRSRKPAK